jgi:phage terminase Nu1 subunit (DNA packaging protein)
MGKDPKVEKLEPIAGPIPVDLLRAAELCGVTEKTIRSWAADGMPVMQVGKRGRSGVKTVVDLVEVLRWYLEQDALDAAKTRLASAQADKHEMENAARRGELAEIADVERTWSDMVLATRARLLSIPMKLAAQLTNVADANIVAAKIRAEIASALHELADGKAGGRGSKGTRQRRAGEVPATAGDDGKRVGRRKKKAEQRIVS